jgi:phage tail sheath protein FI
MFFANGGGDCIIISVGAYKPVVGDLPVADDLQAGLDVLRTTDGPTLIVMPEAQSLPVQGYRRLHDAALAQCAERQDRFLIMDMHAGGTPTAEPVTTSVFLNDVQAFRDNAIGAAHLGYGAVYAPNLSTTLPLSIDEGTTRIIGASSGGRADLETLADLRKRNRSLYTLSRKTLAGLTNILPPSGAIAGLYARTDRDQGVWKSPANAQLANVTAPMVQIDGAALDEMRTDTDSGKSINPVRTLPGRGVLVWGGRTLAGNDPEWQYIATRRFITFVETSVRKGLEQFVFEPNVAQTWIRANTVVTDFLTGLWRQGALQGQVPAQAFGVSVGLGSTMTREDVEAGRMILLLSLATTRPAEFISIRVTQQVATP